jgi:hypothetical protein
VEECGVAQESIRESFWLPHRVLLAEEETIREIAAAMRAAITAEAVSSRR